MSAVSQENKESINSLYCQNCKRKLVT